VVTSSGMVLGSATFSAVAPIQPIVPYQVGHPSTEPT
jgi:hypothetical protein